MATKPPMLGGTAIKPVERHGMEAVRYFFHNPDTGEIMTRTPMSWLLITVFYVIYYSCLAAFWAICMVIFLKTTISYDEPKWQNTNGIIGESPGLVFRPRPSEKNIIMFNKDSSGSQKVKGVPNWQDWTKSITDFLEAYKNATKNRKGRGDCDEMEMTANEDHSCPFNIEQLGKCGKPSYGYDMGTPCIYLKLNRVYGLENKAYDKSNLPEDMPEELKNSRVVADKHHVWVHCDGKDDRDKELLQDVKYFSMKQGFSNRFFPYLGQQDYMSPLVAAQFYPRLPQAIDKTIHIECRAWAKNIGYSRRNNVGIMSLELRILDYAASKKLMT